MARIYINVLTYFFKGCAIKVAYKSDIKRGAFEFDDESTNKI